MERAIIPKRFPAVDGDLIMSSAIDAGIGLFTNNVVVEFNHKLDRSRLAQALNLILDAQPILGCRLVINGRNIYWARLNKREWNSLYLLQDSQEYEKFKTLQVDSRTGPQVMLGVYNTSVGDRLIIKASHQVGDGGGLHDITHELSCIYNRLKHEPSYLPDPNIDGSRSGKQIIGQIPWTALPVIIANFIKLVWDNNHLGVTHILPLSEWQHTSWMYKIRHIPPERTARIVAYGKKNKATLNDVLISAYLRALAQMGGWDGTSALRLQLTVDLRAWYLQKKRAGGICNLSGFEYVNLGTDPGKDFSSTLNRVSAITKARKASYCGLSEACLTPLATLMPYPWMAKMVDYGSRKKAVQKKVPHLLTNTGLIPPEIVTFDQQPHAAWILPSVLFPPAFLTLVSGYGESLTMSTGVSQGSYALVDAFFDQMIAELPD
jgi:NRPS condensation-like uncharacterized protein